MMTDFQFQDYDILFVSESWTLAKSRLYMYNMLNAMQSTGKLIFAFMKNER